MQERHSTADISEDVNISAVEHLAMHRIGVKPGRSLLQFETSLRKNSKEKKKEKVSIEKDRQKNWYSLPRKDRHEESRFIKTKSIRKKFLNEEDFETGADLSFNYPKFNEKIIRIRNCNHFRHMLKG